MRCRRRLAVLAAGVGALAGVALIEGKMTSSILRRAGFRGLPSKPLPPARDRR